MSKEAQAYMIFMKSAMSEVLACFENGLILTKGENWDSFTVNCK